MRQGKIFYNNEGRQVGNSPIIYKTLSINLTPWANLSDGTATAYTYSVANPNDIRLVSKLYQTFKCNGIKTISLSFFPIIIGIEVKGIFYGFKPASEYSGIHIGPPVQDTLGHCDIMFKFNYNPNTKKASVGAAHYTRNIVEDNEIIIVHYIEKV